MDEGRVRHLQVSWNDSDLLRRTSCCSLASSKRWQETNDPKHLTLDEQTCIWTRSTKRSSHAVPWSARHHPPRDVEVALPIPGREEQNVQTATLGHPKNYGEPLLWTGKSFKNHIGHPTASVRNPGKLRHSISTRSAWPLDRLRLK